MFSQFENRNFYGKETSYYEDDISAKEKTEIKGSWFQKKNEHSEWKKSFGRKKSKGKKEIVSVGHNLL